MKHVRLLSKSDYRDFTTNIEILESEGYEVPYEVEYLETDEFKIRIIGDHDWDALDIVLKRAQEARSV